MTEHRIAMIIDANGKSAIGVFDATTNAMLKTLSASDLLNKKAAEGGDKADAASKKWEQYGRNVGETIRAGVLGLAALLGKQIASADAAGKLAQKLGVSTEFISEMGFSAKSTGGSLAGLESGLFSLGENAAKAADGAKKPSAAFRALGIDVRDVHGQLKSLEQLLPELADRFARMPDGPRESAIAVALLGSSARELLPLLNKGSAGIAELRGEAIELGHSISGQTARDAGEFMDRLQALLDLTLAFGNRAIKPLLPLLNTMAELFLRDATASSKAAADSGILTGAFKALAITAAVVRGAIQALVNVLAGAWDVAVKSSQTGSKLVGQYWDGVLAGIEKTWEGDLSGAVDVMSKARGDMVKTAEGGAKDLKAAWGSMSDGITDAANEASAAIADVLDPAIADVRETAESALPPIDGLGEGFLGLGDDGKAAAEHLKFLAERAADVSTEAAKLREEMADLEAELDGPLAAASRDYEQQLERINRLHFEGAISTEEATRWSELLARQLRETKDATSVLIEDLEFERSLIGMTNVDREVAIQLRQLEAGATEEQRAAVEGLIREIVAEGEAHEQRNAQIEESSRAWRNFTDGLVDAAFRGTESVKQYFKRMLQDLIKQWASSALLRMMSSFFGGGNAGLAMAGGQGGGMMSMLGSMFTGGGAGGAGGGNILSSFGGAGGSFAQYAPALAAIAGGAYGFQNRGSSNGSAGSVGAGLAYGTAGYVGGTVALGAFTGAAGATAGAGAAAAAGGAMSGAAGAAMAIPVIGWIIAAIAAIDYLTGGKVFGSRFRPESSTSTISVGEEGGTASATVRDVRNRSMFQGRQWRTRNVDPGDEAREAAGSLFDAVEGAMSDAARQLVIDVPEIIDASIRTVVEYTKKGKVKSTKILVDILGRTWEEVGENAAELAGKRVIAEATIAAIDAAFAPLPEVIADAIPIPEIADRVGRRLGGGSTAEITHAGEASQIAERWRDDAEDLMTGAQTLLAIAGDVRNGFDLLGTGTLTPIIDLLDELALGGEPLLATYQRIAGATRMLDEALAMTGVALDLGREAYVRHAAAIIDAAGGIDRARGLFGSFEANYFSEEERGRRGLARMTTAAETQFGDIGLNLGDFTGEGGMAALRQMFEREMPSLSAEATVEWLEALDALAQVTAAQSSYNQILGQAAARTAQQSADARALLIGVANERAYSQMTTAQRAIADVNARWSDLRIALNSTNPTLEEAAELERARGIAIGDASAALRAQGDELIEGLVFDESLVGMTEVQRTQAEINREFDTYVGTLLDLGFSLDGTEVATVNQIRANRLLRAETDAAAESAEAAAEALQSMSWTDIFGGIEQFFAHLREMAAPFTREGVEPWMTGRTGLTLSGLDDAPANRSQILGEWMGNQVAFVADMNAQRLRLQAELARTPWGDGATIALLQGQIAAITSTLTQVGDELGESLAYINAVFDEQIGSVLGDLAREFGAGNPLADINARFDALRDKFTAWGATAEELAEIEAYRAIAILRAEADISDAIDARYEAERRWIESLAQLRDSLLLDEQLTTLTPQQRMAEAQRQYDAGLAAIDAASLTAGTDDDEAARSAFDGLSRSLLSEARSFFGSSDAYTQIFNRVLADINSLIAASPVTTAQQVTTAYLAQPSSAAGTQTAAIDVTPVTAGIAGLRSDTQEQTRKLVEELRLLQNRFTALEGATRDQTAEIRRSNDQALVRT